MLADKCWLTNAGQSMLPAISLGTAGRQLKRRPKLCAHIAKKVADEGGRRGFWIHLSG